MFKYNRRHDFCLEYSLGNAIGSAGFKVIVDGSGLSNSLHRHLVDFSTFTVNLHVDIGNIFSGKGLTFSNVEGSFSLSSDLVKAGIIGNIIISVLLRVEISKEIIVFIISLKLDGVLVSSEKSVVSIGHVSHVSSLKRQ